MRKPLMLIAAFALTACAGKAEQPQGFAGMAGAQGLTVNALIAGPPVPARYDGTSAALRAMTAPPSRAKLDFAVAQKIEIALDDALPHPVLAVQDHFGNKVVLRDFAGPTVSAARQQGILRRLLEEELQHAFDTDLFYKAMPGSVEDGPEEIIASMMLEAHARASISQAFAADATQGRGEGFYLEAALCKPRILTALVAPSADTRRAAAREVALGFMSGQQGRLYGAFEANRLGSSFQAAMHDPALIARVYAAAGDIFTLAGDTQRYLSEADLRQGLASMIGGPGALAAQGDLWLSQLLPMMTGLSPCRVGVVGRY